MRGRGCQQNVDHIAPVTLTDWHMMIFNVFETYDMTPNNNRDFTYWLPCSCNQMQYNIQCLVSNSHTWSWRFLFTNCIIIFYLISLLIFGMSTLFSAVCSCFLFRSAILLCDVHFSCDTEVGFFHFLLFSSTQQLFDIWQTFMEGPMTLTHLYVCMCMYFIQHQCTKYDIIEVHCLILIYNYYITQTYCQPTRVYMP